VKVKPSPVVPASDLDALPVILTLDELAPIYRLSPATIRSQLQRGTFAPRPWDKYPYRWRRDDVLADLKRVRPTQPRRPHGFASAIGKPRAVKATLSPLPARRGRR
jgi:hypothetical protein